MDIKQSEENITQKKNLCEKIGVVRLGVHLDTCPYLLE